MGCSNTVAPLQVEACCYQSYSMQVGFKVFKPTDKLQIVIEELGFMKKEKKKTFTYKCTFY